MNVFLSALLTEADVLSVHQKVLMQSDGNKEGWGHFVRIHNTVFLSNVEFLRNTGAACYLDR